MFSGHVYNYILYKATVNSALSVSTDSSVVSNTAGWFDT